MTPPRRALLPAVLLALALALPALAGQFSGRVVGVVDGDTLDVLRDGRAERVRLAEIDCPERRQPFGQAAKAAAAELAFGTQVTVRVEERDRYGRSVGHVLLADGRSLNRELVRGGYAWWYRRYSRDPTLGALEDEAREARRGLWAEAHPIPPWEFRRRR